MFARALVAATTAALVLLAMRPPHVLAADAGRLDYGSAGLAIPEAPAVNGNSPQIVAMLGERAARTVGADRLRCIRDLGECRLPAALPYLARAGADTDPAVRAAAANALAMVADPAGEPTLSTLANDLDPRVRREAVRAAAATGAGDLVTRALRDQDESVLTAAITGAGTPAQLDVIADRLPSLPVAVRPAAIEALARDGARGRADAVAGFTREGNSVAERAAAVTALGQLKADEHVGDVVRLLADGHPTVRRSAVRAIEQLAPRDDLYERLSAALADADGAVRAAAAEALSRNPSPAFLPQLIRLARDEYGPAREAAWGAMTAVGPAAAPAAAEMLADARPDVRRGGSLILGRLRSDTGLTRHIALLSDTDPSVLAQAAESLGRIGNDTAAGPLLAVVKRITEAPEGAAPPPEAAAAALVACARLNHLPAAPLARTIVADAVKHPPVVRGAAAYALGALGADAAADATDLLFALYNDPFQVDDVKLEAVKALGHLGAKDAAERLGELAQTEADVRLRWIAHWAHGRITGRAMPFVPPPRTWTADVCIAEIGEGEPAIAPVLALGAFYRPSAWAPVRLLLSNGTAQPLDGHVTLPVTDEDARYDLRVAVNVPPRTRLTLDTCAYIGEGPGGGGERVAGVEWTSHQGGRLARGELLGRPIGAAQDVRAEWSGGKADTLLLYVTDATTPPAARGEASASAADPYDVGALAAQILSAPAAIVKPVALQPHALPRQVAAYDGCRYVVFGGIDPDSLDLAQREALHQWVRGGGILIVAGGRGDDRRPAAVGRSWLAPHLPVHLIGWREATALGWRETGASLRMRGVVAVDEAVSREEGAVPVAGDGRYVHAAFRPAGIGRVAFTSFPAGALDPRQSEATNLWRRLVGADDARPPWHAITTPQQRHDVLQALIGSPAIPWRWAAAMSSGFALAFAGVHAFAGVRRRPTAFVLLALAAALAAGGIVLMAAARSAAAPTVAGRVVVLDVTDRGGAAAEETVALIGGGNVSLRGRTPHAALRPSIVRGGASIGTVQLLPPAADDVRATATQIESLWESRAFVGEVGAFSAAVEFGPDGARLRTENGLRAPLLSPALVWGEPLPTPDIAMGTGVRKLAASDVADARAVARLSGGDAAREKVLAALVGGRDALPLSAAVEPKPFLIGWLGADDAGPPPLITPSRADLSHQRVLVRAPVAVRPSAAGSTIKVDPPFVRLVNPGAGGLPYDAAKRRWMSSDLTGQWLVGFAAPREAGTLRPVRVTLVCDVSAPRHALRLTRDQCRGGREPAENPAGRVVAAMDRPIRPVLVQYDCGPDDFDEDGRVWLLLQVDRRDANGPAPSWEARSIDATLEARVLGLAAAAAAAAAE